LLPSPFPLCGPRGKTACKPHRCAPGKCKEVVSLQAPKKIDIASHVLVPTHSIISEEEAKAILEKLDISPNQLPSISVKDPIAKSIQAKTGDTIKITRKTPKTVYYRRVIE